MEVFVVGYLFIDPLDGLVGVDVVAVGIFFDFDVGLDDGDKAIYIF